MLAQGLLPLFHRSLRQGRLYCQMAARALLFFVVMHVRSPTLQGFLSMPDTPEGSVGLAAL